MPSPMKYAEKAIRIDKITATDPFGGLTTTYVDGAEFMALISLSGSVAQLVAEQRGYSGTYTITVSKKVPADFLEFHTIFRTEDGRVFRITRDPDEQVAPISSQLDYKVGEAEKFIIPTN